MTFLCISRRAAVRVLLPVFLCVLVVHSLVRAEVPVRGRLESAEAVNAAETNWVDAHLERSRQELAQVQDLREMGFASWMQAARAELNVTRWQTRREAAGRFQSFLSEMRKQINALFPDDGDGGSERLAVVQWTLPGSVRLAGWQNVKFGASAEVFLTLEHQRERYAELAAMTEAKAAAAGVRLVEIRKRAEGQALRKNAEEASQSLRAEAAIAEAERDLAGALQKQYEQRVRFIVQQQGLLRDADRVVQKPIHEISSDSHPDLLRATLNVAAFEARADGDLRAAEVSQQRHALRHQAVQQLFDDGFASRQEVTAARESLDAAEFQVASLQARAEFRRRVYEAMRKPSAAAPNTVSVRFVNHRPSRSVTWSDWEHDSFRNVSDKVIRHPAAVAHLIELRRRQTAAAAICRELAAELEFHREVFDRTQAIKQGTSSSDRELVFSRLDVQYQRAKLAGAVERFQALQLEETRFVIQIDQQTAPARPGKANGHEFALRDYVEMSDRRDFSPVLASFSDADLAKRADCCASLQHMGSHPWLADFTVSAQGSEDLDALVWHAHHRRLATGSNLHFEPDRFRIGSDLLASLSAPVVRPDSWTIERYRRACACDAPFAARSIFDESYSRCFAFGIRRTSVDGRNPWRWRSSPVGGPWYLPGSPTNFR